jgi:hypothetical protein
MTFNLLTPRARTGATIIVDGIPILIADATISESHTSSAVVTMHPREVGTDLADHIQPKLPEVRTSLVFSATPLEQVALPGRVESAYALLTRLQSERTLVTLVTTLKVYEGAALVELSAPVSAATGQALMVDATWRLVSVVSTQQVAIPADILRGTIRSSGQTKPTTKDQVSDPDAAATAALGDTKEKRRSILFGLARSTGAI